MKSPEEIKSNLKEIARYWRGWNEEEWANDSLAYIDQLEEQIQLMKVQMHGDCGVCKHRRHAQVTQGGPRFDGPCAACIRKESRPAWEYEGLPELPKKGATI